MGKGAKFLLCGVIVLALSVAAGFLSVVYVFDTLPNGDYRVESMYVGGKLISSEDAEYVDMYSNILEFSIRERSFTITNSNRLGAQFEHRLRGGFVGSLFLELRGEFSDKETSQWVQFDGTATSLYERVTVERGSVIWEVLEPNQPVKKWIYNRVV
jgi:hypothetical protein